MVWRLVFNLLLHFKTYKFRKWIELEDKKSNIIRASEERKEEFPKLLCSFLSDALDLNEKTFEKFYWYDVFVLFLQVSYKLQINQFIPFISIPPENKPKKEIWDYEGRTWHYYSHLLSKHYGWTSDYIANLSVLDVLYQVQEILISEQLDREFTWGMSEASVTWDAKSKTAKPNPLPRPYWMKQANPEAPLPIPKIKLPKNWIPLGEVNYDAVKGLEPHEVEHK